MALKCLRWERELYAYNIETEEDWAALRVANQADKALRMPCCGAGVVLRTSSLGTRHFAHARRGNCTTAPETAEHLLAKSLVVEGIRRTDWAALPEQAGTTPAGEAWQADVLAVKGAAQVVFEIQWSRQDFDETRRRQQRYAESGVRGLWFFRQKNIPVERAVPAFRLMLDEEERRFDVLLPSPNYYSEHQGREDPLDWWQQRVPLPEFVAGALERRLKFAPALGRRLPVLVEAAYADCWRCKQRTGLVMGLVFAASRLFPGHPDIPVSIHEMDDDLPNGAAEITAILPPELLRQHGIGAVKLRHSKTVGHPYLSNGCVRCDAIQGRFYEHEILNDAQIVFETEAEFKSEWMPDLGYAQPYVERWWFDPS